MLQYLTFVVPVVLATSTLAAVPVYAQSTGATNSSITAPRDSTTRRPRVPEGVIPGEHQSDTLFKDITLTAEQRAKVKALRQAYKARLRARMEAFSRSGVTKQTLKQRNEIPDLRPLHKEHFAELRAVLDTAQQRIFDNNVKAQTDEVPRLIRPWPDKKQGPNGTKPVQTKIEPTTK